MSFKNKDVKLIGISTIEELIENKERREKMLNDYADIRNALGGTGASAAVAKAMLQELNSFPQRS